MAKPFPSFSNHSYHLPFSSPSLVASIAVLSIFALVIFLCTSSRKSKKPILLQQRNFVAKVNSNISSRAISIAKMISWRKVEAADEDEGGGGGGGFDLSGDDYDDEVWRKTIIRGERCRPLEFSGKIDYDSDGNLLCDSKREFKSVG
ncbi:hypothetical protein SDJN02_00323, partial [Cucurbita argyrosperma subsp. argyrosperma]